ncbi:hypothetical protein [Paraburkholderia ferrariae]|uniref:hypothetical protein n=1 Tax=Paraburkholderia ferrariae TaxID=386056 RepID=UPI0004839197|nr:hypothetical protein [Paraburkholderia ferrariae]
MPTPIKTKKSLDTAASTTTKTAKSGTKAKSDSVVGKIVRAGVSTRRAASRADAVGHQRKEDRATTRRRSLTQAEVAQLRLEEAEARRDDLPAATRERVLDFQLDFVIGSGMLLFSEDPATLASARADAPERDERVAGFLKRTFGTRKPADLMIARFVPISDFKGNTLIRTLIPESAGVDVAAVIDRAAARADERVGETTERLRARHKQRVATQRAEHEAQQARDARRLAEYPGEWLADHASELAEVNSAAGGQTVTDPRVVSRLFDIARKASEARAAHPEGDATAAVELVVGELINAFNSMALHERRQNQDDRQRIRELEAKIEKLGARAGTAN